MKDQSSSAAAAEADSDDDDKLQRLLLTYQVRQYTAKMQPAHSHRADELLVSAYHMYIDIKVFALLSALFHVTRANVLAAICTSWHNVTNVN